MSTGHSAAWLRGYWDGFAEVPPALADTEYLLGHMAGESAQKKKRKFLPPLVYTRKRT